jgi:hypothetical protein
MWILLVGIVAQKGRLRERLLGRYQVAYGAGV